MTSLKNIAAIAAIAALLDVAPALAGDTPMSGKEPVSPATNAAESWPDFGDKLADLKVFVLPPGEFLLRGNVGGGWFKDGSSELILSPEIAIGLPGRFELSVLDELVKPTGSNFETGIILPELRWAVAPWGHLPLNPTLGFAWEFIPHDSDIYKTSLYLSEDIGDQWLWAANFTYQKRVGGDKERELIGKMGLHYIVIPKRLTIGVEAKYEHAKIYNGEDAGSGHEFLLGPAMIWCATDNLTVRVGSAFGATKDSPKNESTLSLEWKF